jgi:hypothetical protein
LLPEEPKETCPENTVRIEESIDRLSKTQVNIQRLAKKFETIFLACRIPSHAIFKRFKITSGKLLSQRP